jgi:hypothetical protein
VTHAFMDQWGNKLLAGSALWDKLLHNSSVSMVLCGHMSSQYYMAENNTDRNIVHEVLSDYQDWNDGGAGYLRLYKFYPTKNIIHVETYSPWLNRYAQDKLSTFDIPFIYD